MQKASLFAFAFRSKQKLKLLLATAITKLRFVIARKTILKDGFALFSFKSCEQKERSSFCELIEQMKSEAFHLRAIAKRSFAIAVARKLRFLAPNAKVCEANFCPLAMSKSEAF